MSASKRFQALASLEPDRFRLNDCAPMFLVEHDPSSQAQGQALRKTGCHPDQVRGRLFGIMLYPASLRERSVAAATAFFKSGGRPSSRISTSSAAAVVPPGEVTFSRKVAASSAER